VKAEISNERIRRRVDLAASQPIEMAHVSITIAGVGV
jgi:hypothetical protein